MDQVIGIDITFILFNLYCPCVTFYMQSSFTSELLYFKIVNNFTVFLVYCRSLYSVHRNEVSNVAYMANTIFWHLNCMPDISRITQT